MRLLKNNILKFSKEYLLATFAFFLPLSLLFNGNTIVMILLILVSIHEFYSKKTIIYDKTGVLISYFFLLLFSLFYSHEFNTGIKIVIRSLPFLLIPVGLITTKTIDKQKLKSISVGFYIGNLLTFVISLLYAIIIYKNNPLPLEEGFSHFTNFVDIHPSYYSIYLLFSTSLLFWVYKKDRRFTAVIKLILFVVLILIQLYLKSRAGLLATILIICLFTILNHKKKIIASVLSIVLALFLILFKTLKNQDFLNRNVVESAIDRLSIWLSSLDVIKKNIFIGVGIGDYQYELDRQYFLNNFDHGIHEKLNTHNQFLQTLVSNGLLGLLLFLSIFYFLFKRYLRFKNEIILYFIATIVILMFFDSVLIVQHGILFFTFFSTILLKIKTE